MISHKLRKKNKGQISLEYILVLASVVALLGLIVTASTVIYKKNINAIDNRELIKTGTELQEVFDCIELMPASIQEIEINPEDEWSIKYKDYTHTSITLYNLNKQIDIYSISNINILKNKIDNKSIILIKKENNKIIIDIEKVE